MTTDDRYEPQRLERWKMPRHYHGTEWHGYWVAPCGRMRDSDTLEQSNWHAQLTALGGESKDGKSVVVVRERHFLCGWVEWLAVREDATAALRAADELAARLEVYPVLDENDLGMRDLEADTHAEGGPHDD